MTRLYIIFLILACSFPVAARADTVHYLLQADPGPFCRITAVNASTQKRLPFGHEGGRIDISAGVVVGKAGDGSEISVPLTDVSHLTIRFERGGRTYEYDARVDPLLADVHWPPLGRIRRVLLTAGVTIDFDLVGPGVNLDDRTLFWSCKDEAATRIPFEEIALVQIQMNSFITDLSDLADFCALAGIDAASGEKLEVAGASGWLDQTEEVIRYDGQEIPLTEVHRIRMVDCRSRKIEEPAVVQEGSGSAGESELEVFDFGHLVLTDQRVRLHEMDGGRRWIVGTVITQDPHSLEVLTSDGTVAVSLEKIDKLKISRGSSNNAGKGALIGGVIVGAAGLGLGLAMLSDSFFDTSQGDVVAVTFLGAGVGALLGGGIGALAKTEKWEDVDKIEISPVVTPDKSLGLALAWKF